MRNFSKSPRTFHPNRLFDERAKLRKDATTLEARHSLRIDQLASDNLQFLEKVCKLKLFAHTVELAQAFNKYQFNAVRWSRQSGKSTTIGALHLADAWIYPDLNVGFVGPSWSTTKLNMRRVGGLCRNLPQQGLEIQKTHISLPNGSVIDAFPNNPDTIRGNTFHRVWWDEANHTPNDEDLYDAIIFTLSTTNGKLTASSTPFATDKLFWKFCNHEDYADFHRSHLSYEKALEPNGPLKSAMLETLKRQYGSDPASWRREMEAEWAEDEDAWLPQSLIVSCIGTVKNCGQDLQEFSPEGRKEGEFFAGLDLAQTRDYCVFSIIERLNDKLFLRHLKIFQQPTKYAHVLGYVKSLQDRWGGFQKICVDVTREGPSFIDDMGSACIQGAEGIVFSVPRKSEMAGLLKQRMNNQQFYYPFLTWETPNHGDICSELNVERYELRKDGTVGFCHPNGTHDDVFWSIALALYGSVQYPMPGTGAVLPY